LLAASCRRSEATKSRMPWFISSRRRGADLSPLIDVYLLIDVSGSMALGATNADIAALQAPRDGDAAARQGDGEARLRRRGGDHLRGHRGEDLTFLVLLILAGAGFDFARSRQDRSRLDAALDAAVLAGAQCRSPRR
jgi:hypothetical protein